MSIQKKLFGRLADGRDVYEFILKNTAGMTVKIISYGAAIREIAVPDRNGRFSDVVGGYDDLDSYVGADGYQGAVIGRVGNRISKGRFSLDGKEYRLFINNGPNHLHGGEFGFNAKIWDQESIDADELSVTFCYTSPDMEEGYPGNLDVRVKYTLQDDNALRIDYRANTDQKTPVNLTNHTYFNLSGYDSGSIHSHELTIDADSYLPTDETLIPTGELKSVAGTPFDFRVPKEIGKDICCDDVDLKIAGGYDHCFVFTTDGYATVRKRAELYDKESGRIMEVFTDQPCVQFYSGNFLNNERYPFKNGYKQSPQTLLCLETQKMPDSVNHKNFTDVILLPGDEYRHTVIYKFLTK